MSSDRAQSRPQPLTVRRHLKSATYEELKEFRTFWTPESKGRMRRHQIEERLLDLMSDENVVHERVDELSDRVRTVLMALLRRPDHLSDLAGLFRGADGLEMEHYEAEAALAALSRRGFIRSRKGQEWQTFGRPQFGVPTEMARILRGLSGGDRRSFPEIFLHEEFRPSTDPQDALGAGPLPERVSEAIDGLPDETLSSVARTVLERFGGILTRREFPETFHGENGNGVRWASREFLEGLTPRGLGTVGHLDLRGHGLGLDDDAVILFHEVHERWLEENGTEPAYDFILKAHGDLMTDVVTALDLAAGSPVRVGKDGRVYKAARDRISEHFVFPAQELVEREEITRQVLEVVRRLELALDSGDGHLTVTAAGQDWVRLPLIKKVAAAYGVLCADGQRTLRAAHLGRLRGQLVHLLREAEDWIPLRGLAMRARNRYLLELTRERPRAIQAGLAVRPGALTELGGAAVDILLRSFFPLGLVDIAMVEGEPAAIRLSRLGQRHFLTRREGDTGESRPLIINPDFEILVLPEGDVDDLLHALDRVAVRVQQEEVIHYKLDRARVERSAVGGDQAEGLVELLQQRSRTPVPQNVEYSIRSWCEGVRSASVERGVLLSTSDPHVLEAIQAHPVLGGFVIRAVSPTALFLREEVMDRKILQELRGLGVHLTG